MIRGNTKVTVPSPHVNNGANPNARNWSETERQEYGLTAAQSSASGPVSSPLNHQPATAPTHASLQYYADTVPLRTNPSFNPYGEGLLFRHRSWDNRFRICAEEPSDYDQTPGRALRVTQDYVQLSPMWITGPPHLPQWHGAVTLRRPVVFEDGSSLPAPMTLVFPACASAKDANRAAEEFCYKLDITPRSVSESREVPPQPDDRVIATDPVRNCVSLRQTEGGLSVAMPFASQDAATAVDVGRQSRIVVTGPSGARYLIFLTVLAVLQFADAIPTRATNTAGAWADGGSYPSNGSPVIGDAFISDSGICGLQYTVSMSSVGGGPGSVFSPPLLGCYLTTKGGCVPGGANPWAVCGGRILAMIPACAQNAAMSCSSTITHNAVGQCSDFYGGGGTGIYITAHNNVNTFELSCTATVSIFDANVTTASGGSTTVNIPNPLPVTVSGTQNVVVTNTPTVAVSGAVAVTAAAPLPITAPTPLSVSISGTPTVHVTGSILDPIFAVIAGVTASIPISGSVNVATMPPISINTLNMPSALNVSVTSLPPMAMASTLYADPDAISEYLWPIDSKRRPPVSVWDLSSKQRNKLAHSANGNIDRASTRQPTDDRSSIKKYFHHVEDIDHYVRQALAVDPSVFNRYAVLALIDDCIWATIDSTLLPDEYERSAIRSFGRPQRQAVQSTARRGGSVSSAAQEQPKKATADQLEKVTTRLRARLNSSEAFMDWIASSSPSPQFVAYLWTTAMVDANANPVAYEFVESYIGQLDAHSKLTRLAPLIPCLRRIHACSLAWTQWLAYCGVHEPLSPLPTDSPPSRTSTSPTRSASPGVGPGTDVPAQTWSPTSAQLNKRAHVTNGNWALSAKARNRLAHALNGNTSSADSSSSGQSHPSIVVPDMDAVVRKRTIAAIMSSATPSTKSIDPVAMVAQVTGIAGPAGITAARVPGADHFRNQTVGANNVLSIGMDVDAPEAYCEVRNTRDETAAYVLIPSTTRTGWTMCGVVAFPSRPYTLTATAVAQAEVVAMGKAREDAVAANGFRMPDITAFNSMLQNSVFAGDSMVVPFIKLHLYANILSWLTPPDTLPRSSLFSKTDAFTQTNLAAGIGLDYNAGFPTANENCGGNQSVFPFGSRFPRPTVNAPAAPAGSGIITFHQDLSSVPPAERSSVLMVPPALLTNGELSGSAGNLALLVLAYAAFPCGLWRLHMGTYDLNFNQAADQSAALLANLISIPGQSTIRVLLPINGAHRNPTNQPQANDNLYVQPTTGPTPSGGLAANATLNVCFGPYGTAGAPGGTTEYPLCEWLYTWLAGNNVIDPTTIVRFASTLAQLTQRFSDYAAAKEWADAMSIGYPLQQMTQPGNPWHKPSRGVYRGATAIYNGQMRVRVAADFPLPPPSTYHFVFPDSSTIFLAACSMNIISPTPLGEIGKVIRHDSIASPFNVQYQRYRGRHYALLWHLLYSLVGITTETWNTIYTNSTLTSLREWLRGFWMGQTVMSTSPISMVAQSHPLFDVLSGGFTHYGLEKDGFGLNMMAYTNAPPVGIAGVLAAYDVPVGIYCPTIMTDLWAGMHMKEMPLAFAPFPAPLKGTRGVSSTTMSVTRYTNGSITVPLEPDRRIPSLSHSSIPVRNDVECWNSRLLRWAPVGSGGGGQFMTLDGNLWALILPLDGYRPVQHIEIPDVACPNPLRASQLNSSTWCYPLIDATGLTIVVGADNARAANVSQVLAGVAVAATEAWVCSHSLTVPNVLVTGPTSRPSWANWAKFASPASDPSDSKNASGSPLSDSSASQAAQNSPLPSVTAGLPGLTSAVVGL